MFPVFIVVVNNTASELDCLNPRSPSLCEFTQVI